MKDNTAKKVMKSTPSERMEQHTNDETPMNTIEISTKDE